MAPEWASSTITDITVELFASTSAAIPALSDSNTGDTHALSCSPQPSGLSINELNGI